MTTPSVPKQADGVFSINVGNLTLECTRANSGRITAFSYQQRNILTEASVHPFNFGSTFWTAPQSDWDWPPPAAMDSDGTWSGNLDGNAIVLQGPPCEKLKIQLTKRIRRAAIPEAVVIEYAVKNVGDTPRSIAPWEISRVAPGGMTFFPQGKATYPPPSWQEPLVTQLSGGINWFVHSDDTVTGQHKLFADGREGWIAHVDKDLLFLKSFQPMPAENRAPGESEIEIYAVPEYVEVEQQGAYQPLLQGASIVWPVTWYLRKIPANIPTLPGNEALVAFVNSVLVPA